MTDPRIEVVVTALLSTTVVEDVRKKAIQLLYDIDDVDYDRIDEMQTEWFWRGYDARCEEDD